MNESIAFGADPSRLAALRVGPIRRVCSLLAPCHPGASTPIIDRLIPTWALRGARGPGILAALGLFLALAAPRPAAAQLEVALGDRAEIDWTRGILSAVGAKAGDLRAPSPAIARVKAERLAREAARARLAELARGLPLAGGGTVGDALARDPAAAARLEAALARSLDLEVDYGSDGSVVLTAGLPVEAVRVALFGAPAAPAGGEDEDPTALVVDARGLGVGPGVGLRVAAGGEPWAAPVVFHLDPKRALADPRAGARPVRIEARGVDGGVLELSADAPVAQARRAGALVVVLVKKGAADPAGKRKPTR